MNDYDLSDKRSVEEFGDRVDTILKALTDPVRQDYAQELLTSLAKEYMLPLIDKLQGVLEWKERVLRGVNEA